MTVTINLWWMIGLAAGVALSFLAYKLLDYWVSTIRLQYTGEYPLHYSMGNAKHWWSRLQDPEAEGVTSLARIDKDTGDLWLCFRASFPFDWTEPYLALRFPHNRGRELAEFMQQIGPNVFLALVNAMATNPEQVTQAVQRYLDSITAPPEPPEGGNEDTAPELSTPGPAARRKRRLEM